MPQPLAEKIKPGFQVRQESKLEDLGYSKDDIARMSDEFKQNASDIGLKRDNSKPLNANETETTPEPNLANCH